MPRVPWSLLASAALLSTVASLVLVVSMALLVALCVPAQREQFGGLETVRSFAQM